MVTAALLMWMPVCGPLAELRISLPAQMVYLFLMSIVPTVPGAWLTFADGAGLQRLRHPDRLWGISVTTTSRPPALIMKLVGGTYLWVIITEHVLPLGGPAREGPGQRPDGHRTRDRQLERWPEALTYDEVEREFARTAAASSRSTHRTARRSRPSVTQRPGARVGSTLGECGTLGREFLTRGGTAGGADGERCSRPRP